ncbi:MAG: DHH family phosphoesterase [Candidatus Heimdallarchaeota archaeon]|nr:MAG: DHH family phosphoesterase [Candidatus Heimdallarchaeota archaeon]
MTNEASFFEACQIVAEDIQKVNNNSPIYIFSHLDADGLTAASILAATISRVDLSYHIRILDRLEYETLNSLKDTLPQGSTVIFSDIGTGVVDAFQKWDQSQEIFIIDHHFPASKTEVSRNVHHLNSHFYSIDGTTDLSGAGVAYYVSIQMDKLNRNLAPLAIIGALGDRQDQGNQSSLIGLNKLIVEDAKKLKLISDAVSVWFFDRTRSVISILRNADFLPFDNELEIRAFLEGVNILYKKGDKLRPFYDLNEEECRRLASELIVQYGVDPNEIYKRDYQLNQEKVNFLKDARVFASNLNACGRIQQPDVGISLCLGDRQTALRNLQLIRKEYSKQIAENIRWASDNLQELEAIRLLDGRKTINDRMIGTIISMLSSKRDQNPKPLLGYTQTTSGKIKISMRLSRFQDIQIDLGHLLTQVMQKVEPQSEVGGHAAAAGAIISERFLTDFITQVNQLILEAM